LGERLVQSREKEGLPDYDELNRWTSKTYSDGTPAVTTTYDVATLDGVTFQNPVGRMLKITGGNANKWQSYDPTGRVATT
jgi:hypothetical protein